MGIEAPPVVEEPAHRRGGREDFHVDRGKVLVTLGVGVLLITGAIALIGHAADYRKLDQAFANASNFWWLPVGLAGEVIAYAGFILAYRGVSAVLGGPRFGYWTTTRIVAVSFGAFVAGSAPGGLAVQFWALRRAGMRGHDAARRVLALNTLEWAALASFAMLAAVAVLLGLESGAPLEMTLTWLVVVPACVVPAIWVSAPGRVGRLSALPERRARPERGEGAVAWLGWARAKARTAFADSVGGLVIVREVLTRPHRYPAGILGYPIYWLGDIVTLYASLRTFGVHIGIASLVLAYTTAYIVTALPLPAGGAGGIEAALAMTLHLVGVPLAPALLGAVLYRVFAFWLPIVPALGLLPTLKQLHHDLARTPQPA